MIKQELLGCLHSKAKWFAINQVKTVNFNVDPWLDKKEDLSEDVEELKYKLDFDEYQKPSSVVIGEKYGRKFPVVTIRDLKVEQFWPLVASSSWKDCSSLRISDGLLLKSLSSTFQQLLDQKLVYKFSTRVYDSVILANRKPCFKGGKTPLLQKKSSASKKQKQKPGVVRTEVTSISFVYYGTSIEHLLTLLHSDGHYGVTVIDVINQNKGKVKGCRQQQDLQMLCRGKPLPYKRAGCPLIQDPEAPLGDKFGRKRHLYHRKLSTGFVEWPELEQEMEEQNPGNELTFFNALRRKEFVEKHGLEGLNQRTRLLFFRYLRKRYGTSRDPYEYWWYNSIATNDALRERHHKIPPPTKRNIPSPETQGSNTKKTASIAASTGGNIFKPPLPMPRREAPDLNTSPRVNPRKLEKDPYGGFFAQGARNKTNIDKWQCLCDVCTGGLLAPDSIIQLHTMMMRDEENEEDNDVETSMRRSPRNSSRKGGSRASGRNNRCVSIEVNEYVNHSATGKIQSESQKGRGNKTNAVWFDSVSDYTTPYWDGAKEMAEVYKEFLPNQPNNLNGKPLNIMYSYDKLRTIKRKKKFSMKQKRLIASLNEDQQKEEPLDYETLKELGILYSYYPDTRKQYKSLVVPKKETGNRKTPTSLMVSWTGKETSLATQQQTHRRNTLPPMRKLNKQLLSDHKLNRGGKRTGSFPQVPDDMLLTLNRLIPTISPDEKCKVFVNNSPKKVEETPDDEEDEEEISFDLKQQSQKVTIPQMIKENQEAIPKDFSALCLAALRIFVIRSETVMVSGDYQHIHSMTVNRHPMCKFPQDYNKSVLTTEQSLTPIIPHKFSEGCTNPV